MKFECELEGENRLSCFITVGYKYVNNSPALAGMSNELGICGIGGKQGYRLSNEKPSKWYLIGIKLRSYQCRIIPLLDIPRVHSTAARSMGIEVCLVSWKS